MALDIELMLERAGCSRTDDVVWDPFFGSGFATRYMRHLGFRVYESGGRQDFFALSAPPRGVTVVVSNPPFSHKQRVLKRLVEWRIRFCLLLPSDVLQRDYFFDTVRMGAARCGADRFEVWLPNKTIRFHYENGVVQPLARFKSSFFVYFPGVVAVDGVAVGGEEVEDAAAEATDGATTNAVPPAPREDLLRNLVKVYLFDYAQRMSTREEAAKQIHTSGPLIGQKRSRPY
ncbi:MAG: hypothetical protein IPK82_23185 [Polyangiaceae bacterium]|nr:hypothetical protein [Polyangiaceae bacterium]